jgi:hypothetical protein
MCIRDRNPAKKGASNPFFKSKYADLSEVIEASRQPLSLNGLSICQYSDEGYVVTQLMHKSGQWVRGRLRITPKDNSAQGIGSALTYARRYSWQMMVGIGAEDDDGEGAMGRAGSAYDPAHAKAPARKKATPKKTPVKKSPAHEEPTKHESKSAGETKEAPASETSVESPDKAEGIIASTPHALDYLKSLNIDPKEMPESVTKRIEEKGIDGFGEMVSTWKMEQEGQL